MTQEEKDLLLKDLCARLPYGVKCKVVDFPTHGLEGDNDKNVWSIASIIYYPPESEQHENVHTIHYYPDGRVMHIYPQIDEIKPYLFPLSSMTEEQKEELDNMFKQEDDICEKIKTDNFEFNFYRKSIFDFLNKYHFDWRGFIPKDLAIDATGLNIY